jgi:NAD(P)-dependent dehydrogenase (short-subunit alcohol dehydrogenase family)
MGPYARLAERATGLALGVRVGSTHELGSAAASIAGPGATSVVALDLSDLDRVAGCVETLLARHDRIAAVACNAA